MAQLPPGYPPPSPDLPPSGPKADNTAVLLIAGGCLVALFVIVLAVLVIFGAGALTFLATKPPPPT